MLIKASSPNIRMLASTGRCCLHFDIGLLHHPLLLPFPCSNPHELTHATACPRRRNYPMAPSCRCPASGPWVRRPRTGISPPVGGHLSRLTRRSHPAGMSFAYGERNDEESKKTLRKAIEIVRNPLGNPFAEQLVVGSADAEMDITGLHSHRHGGHVRSRSQRAAHRRSPARGREPEEGADHAATLRDYHPHPPGAACRSS